MTTKRNAPATSSARVRAVFGKYPKTIRSRLMALRQLIFATAAETDGVGRIEETLKWGQPSYLTESSRSGTTIRIDALKSEPGKYAMFVHCQTDLVAQIRELYPRTFRYEGNRSLIFDIEQKVPEPALRHFIALALTYHRKKTAHEA
jgi:hypothetical protein